MGTSWRDRSAAAYLVLIVCLALLSAGLAPATQAQEPPRISALGIIDREFMSDQRDSVDALAREHLGRQIRGDKTNDLDVLQALLDRRAVKPEQTLELQAMGIVMGDLLADELGMDWVVYEDQYGRSRALQVPDSDQVLFPVTMISRRFEVGATADVEAIYARAVELMQPYLRPLPFQ